MDAAQTAVFIPEWPLTYTSLYAITSYQNSFLFNQTLYFYEGHLNFNVIDFHIKNLKCVTPMADRKLYIADE